jgi:hypothetical protein
MASDRGGSRRWWTFNWFAVKDQNLVVGEKEGEGDVKIAVGGAVVSLRVVAGRVLVPRHQVRMCRGRMIEDVAIEAVEVGVGIGVVTGHQRRED